MLYVDTSVLATPVLKNQSAERILACDRFLQRAVNEGTALMTSWLTWDEFVWVVGRAGGPFDRQRAVVAGESLLEFPYLTFLPVDRRVIELANELMRETSCRPRDCIHAASALLHCHGALTSLDSDFEHAKTLRQGLKIHPLTS